MADRVPAGAGSFDQASAKTKTAAEIRRALAARASGCNDAEILERFRVIWKSIEAEARKRDLIPQEPAKAK